MSPLIALTISIAVLGGVDTFLTATVLPIPVWVTFIAWASFFACGGGSAGFVKSVIANWSGAIIATLALLAIAVLPSSPVFAAISVGVFSGVMILLSSFRPFGYPPAIVFGFASLVGTTAATGHPVTEASIHNPCLIACIAIVVGAAFGFVSERFATLLETRRVIA